MWYGGLLWLVSAVVCRCDLMCRLIKLHEHKVARNMLSNL